jgi:hypothetical protein
MSAVEILAILALTGWAIYRQTIVAEVSPGLGRFKMALIYAGVGLVVGGFDTPTGSAGWAFIVAGLALSLVVGLLRGRLTRVWADPDGRIWRRGTATTVVLFIGLVAVKFALGTLAHLWHVDDGAGFGEVLVMIAVMIAVQAQIIHRRARQLATAAALPQPAAVLPHPAEPGESGEPRRAWSRSR